MPTSIIFFFDWTLFKIVHYFFSLFMNSTIHSSFVVPVGWCFLLLAFPLLILSVAAYSLPLWSLVLPSLLHRWSSSSRGVSMGHTRIRIVSHHSVTVLVTIKWRTGWRGWYWFRRLVVTYGRYRSLPLSGYTRVHPRVRTRIQGIIYCTRPTSSALLT